MMCEVLSKAPLMSKKAPNITSFVPLLLYVRMHSAEQFQGTSLIGRQTGVKVEDTHRRS